MDNDVVSINKSHKKSKIGIIGGGIMGSGLSRYFLYKGYSVCVVEAEKSLVNKLIQNTKNAVSKDVERKKLKTEEAQEFFKNFYAGIDMESLSGSKLIIEATPEDLNLKRKILRNAEIMVDSDTIICTNTSALPISALATSLERPEFFLGTHFFNPAHIMPLVEVIPGLDTAPEVVTQILDFLQSIGKKPIPVKECPGFLVNRVLGAYMNEVMWLLESSAGIQDIETIAMELGFPMGPVTLGEMAG